MLQHKLIELVVITEDQPGEGFVEEGIFYFLRVSENCGMQPDITLADVIC